MRHSVYAAAFAISTALCSLTAAAHPHMFVQAHTELVLNDAAELTAVRAHLLIDELNTLFVLEQNGVVDLDRPLTDAQRAAIGEGIVDGLSYYDYFTDLSFDGDRLDFSGGVVTEVRLVGAELFATIELALAEPEPIRGRRIELAIYDPTYFAAVETMAAPALPSLELGCQSELTKFEPTALDATSLAVLSALSRDETPLEPRVGAQFADWSMVTCRD